MDEGTRRSTFLNIVIISQNRPQLKAVRKKGLDTDKNKSDESDNHLNVYLRFKLGDLNGLYDYTDDTLNCSVPQTSHYSKHARAGTRLQKQFKFAQIFPPESKQTDLFNGIVKRRLVKFINGNSNTIFTYGASGSGKTYTLIGTEDEPGLIPQSLDYLYKLLPPLPKSPIISLNKIQKDLISTEFDNDEVYHLSTHANSFRNMQSILSSEFGAKLDEYDENLNIGVWITFTEIYNENVRDLLDPNYNKLTKTLTICSATGTTYIKNIKHVYASNSEEAYQLLQFGKNNLNYASTSINDHSSRSHCIFTIKLVQSTESYDEIRTSCFNFCDLAGSERAKKTNNVGVRLKESNNINTSLMVLGKCIKLVRDNQKKKEKKLIPFRESKFTRLFENALNGQEEIAILVNISPDVNMFDESMKVLQFSSVAKDIVIEDVEPVLKKPRIPTQTNSTIEADWDIKEDKYLDAILELSDLLKKVKKEEEEEEEEISNKFLTKFEEMLKEDNRKWKLRHKEALEDKENEIERKRRNFDSSVICLDDTTSDEEDLCENCQRKELEKITLEEKFKYLEEQIKREYG